MKPAAARDPHKAQAKSQLRVLARHRVLGTVVGLVLAGIGAGLNALNTSGSTAHHMAAPAPVVSSGQHPEDVAITSCGIRAGYLDGTVRATNHSAVPETYFIQVAFESKDGTARYATGFATFSDLAQGQSSRSQNLIVFKQLANVPVKCVLLNATRSAA